MNENVTIKETFLDFISVADETAAGLVETTCKYIEDIGLDMEKLRDQGYDGASVMSGVHNGVQKLIEDNRSSMHVHYAGHRYIDTLCRTQSQSCHK